MNLERTKPETLAAGVMDYMPSQSAVAHEYAERLNAALARLGLTDRLTLPPAPNTAIDELPAVVDVPLRKTLSVLMGKAQQGDASALATLEWTAQVAESIFAGLHARDFAGDRPLALPSHESLATLSQGVDALLPRKISNGAWSLLSDGTPSDGIQDGMSLVRLLCSSAADSVTELKDDNEGWVMTKALPWSTFPNVTKATLNCVDASIIIARANDVLTEIHLPHLKTVKGSIGIVANCPNIEILDLPNLETLQCTQHSYSYDDVILGKIKGQREMVFPKLKSAYSTENCYTIFNFTECEILRFPELEYIPYIGNARWIDGMDNLKELHMPKFKKVQSKAGWPTLVGSTMANLHTIVLGKIEDNLRQQNSDVSMIVGGANLIHIEIGEGVAVSFNLNQWNPTSVLSDSERLTEFLSNFKTYIAERLSEQGSGLTITLSQAVRDAIEGDPTIAQIITSKGWTISPAPTA